MKEYFSHYLRESRRSDCFRRTCEFDDNAFSSPSTNEGDFRGKSGSTRAANATQLDKHRFAENQCHAGSSKPQCPWSLAFLGRAVHKSPSLNCLLGCLVDKTPFLRSSHVFSGSSVIAYM